ncbi:PH domain-containing protein [Nocardioides donggukensis]|uniref:PH domain-containing protein n=1 Tax=Nocardioides donggukensis TaxID=2774019 RepID=A0A927K7C7_9ACTN|nr:PH domain-containing protein [Nocardioides donggukensis]MBD8870353.1 PH domain-containing protein [Nocardioides donggukensis]
MTTQPTDGPPPTLREPANQVSPRAVSYWRLTAGIGALVTWLALAIGYAVLPQRPWWVTLLLVLVVGATIVHLVLMPRIRFRVHRWEVTPTAVHTRAGWLSREERIAPLSRVQTVDSAQGALMRAFGLMSITVTTASAAGPLTIACLDSVTARAVVAELTEITGSHEGDAT